MHNHADLIYGEAAFQHGVVNGKGCIGVGCIFHVDADKVSMLPDLVKNAHQVSATNFLVQPHADLGQLDGNIRPDAALIDFIEDREDIICRSICLFHSRSMFPQMI